MTFIMDDKLIQEFLQAHVPGCQKITPLAGDASLRKYYRVHLKDKSLVLCQDTNYINNIDNDYPFLVVHKLLQAAGISVPDIYTSDAEKGIFLMQDLGDTLLEDMMKKFTEDDIISIYKKIIDILIGSQSIRGTRGPFSLAFDVDKLMFEFDFFIEHALLGYYDAHVTNADMQDLREAFITIAKILYRPEYFVFTHRDFHSRNIMLKDDEIFIIDFQDARMGLPQYDLASLLRDSYVVMSYEQFVVLKDYYYNKSWDTAIHRMNREFFDFLFDIQAFQRNVKALGTFGYQCSVLGNTKFEKYILPTVLYLSDYILRRPELEQAGSLLSKYLPVY